MTVKFSMEDLKLASEVEDLMLSGREFQRRIVDGKNEYKWESLLDWGMKKLKGRRGEDRGMRSSLHTEIRLFAVL